MKVSKILLASAMLGSMMLASCGGPEAGESTADASASTSKAASSKKSSTSKFSAIWSKDASQHVDANCEHEGKDVEVCINSSLGSVKETVIAKTPHTWGTRSEKVEPSATPKPSSSMLWIGLRSKAPTRITPVPPSSSAPTATTLSMNSTCQLP